MEGRKNMIKIKEDTVSVNNANNYTVIRIKSPKEFDICKNGPQSCITIGNIEVFCFKHFNIFQRFFIKRVFGFEINNINNKKTKKDKNNERNDSNK